MDIPVDAEVHCADGPCGRSTHVILNPTTDEVTHLVVKEKRFPHTKRLVPIALVLETTPHLIRLRCTEDELTKLEPFIVTQFIQQEIPHYYYAGGTYMLSPYVIPEPETDWVSVEHESIPPSELAVSRGSGVEATDGHVGRVDEFLVNPVNGHITHLILREGHLWGQKDMIIPISQIDRIGGDTVYLKLDKKRIGALPTIPVRRRWL
jgi:sporulation protein YlmC with PRC-barrel domain